SARIPLRGTGEAPIVTKVVVATCIRCLRPFRLVFLEDEYRVLLVAFGGEADIVELDFIDAKLGYVLGECDVAVLNLGIRGIGPDHPAILAPRRSVLARLHGEFGMVNDQAFVAENRDTGDSMHVLLMQEVD